MGTKKYNVFISYSRKDYVDEQQNIIPDNFVSKIKERFTAEGITYWFDEEGIYSGQNFIDKIVTNIELSQIFVFLSTANSNNSHWTCKEIASADEFGKHIIPVRVDKTPYNKKVMFRIADLSYIEYYTNPEKGLNDLVNSIKNHLEQIEAEKRRKEEEEKKREQEKKRLEEKKKLEEEAAKQKKREEEKRFQEEQKKTIADIKIKCTKLNNEETKLELDRDNLLLSAERIIDEIEKKSLTDFIVNSSPIRKKCSKEIDELLTKIGKIEKEKDGLIAAASECNKEEFEKQINELATENSKLQNELKKAQDEISNCSSTIHNLNEELTKIKSPKTTLKRAKNEKIQQLKYGLYTTILSLFLYFIGACIYCYNKYPNGISIRIRKSGIVDTMVFNVKIIIVLLTISILAYFCIVRIIKKKK